MTTVLLALAAGAFFGLLIALARWALGRGADAEAGAAWTATVRRPHQDKVCLARNEGLPDEGNASRNTLTFPNRLSHASLQFSPAPQALERGDLAQRVRIERLAHPVDGVHPGAPSDSVADP